ncbi:MAG: hypothetical protein WA865_16900 [Spirulinaceae cyanobacterium]
MEIPDTLTNELRYYLQLQAEKGDLEAETLLAKLAEVTTNENELKENQQVEFIPPPSFEELGC